MKVKKIEIFQNKRGLIGCKWSSLNIFFSGLNDFPFSHYSHRTSISLSDKIPLALALPFIERLRRANKNLSERSFQSSNFWLCIYVLRLRKKGNSIVWLPRCNPSWKFRRESIVWISYCCRCYGERKIRTEAGKGIATLHLEFDRPARTRMSDCTLILHLKAPLYLTLDGGTHKRFGKLFLFVSRTR